MGGNRHAGGRLHAVEQRATVRAGRADRACPGGAQGAQACNADGTGYLECQCPGGGNDLAVGLCNPDCPSQDLAGFDFAGDDLATSDDLSMPDMAMQNGDDLAQPPPDFSGLDLTGIDLTPPPPADFSVAGAPCAVVMILQDTTGSMTSDLERRRHHAEQAASVPGGGEQDGQRLRLARAVRPHPLSTPAARVRARAPTGSSSTSSPSSAARRRFSRSSRAS